VRAFGLLIGQLMDGLVGDPLAREVRGTAFDRLYLWILLCANLAVNSHIFNFFSSSIFLRYLYVLGLPVTQPYLFPKRVFLAIDTIASYGNRPASGWLLIATGPITAVRRRIPSTALYYLSEW